MSTPICSPEPLAKSNPPETLKEHTQAVVDTVRAMAQTIAPYLPRDLQELAVASAYLHDVGKIATGFQRVLHNGGRWEYRHEALSTAVALALGLPEEVCLAILTHHRPANDSCFDAYNDSLTWQRHGQPRWQALLKEMEPYWEWLRGFLPAPWRRRLPQSPSQLPNLHTLLGKAHSNSIVELPPEQRRRLIWLRGLLLAGDHLASGHGSRLPELEQTESFLSTREWHPYQRRVQAVEGHLILQAPTGAGKTEAALLWALRNRRARERIFYVLPTQASIEAMVQRLRRQFGNDAVAPLHHRVIDLEFQRHFSAEESPNYTKSAQYARQQADLYRQFYSPLKVLTPHQILKHMFGSRFFEVGLTELTGALVVLDEIHAYDVHLTALLEQTIAYLSEQYHVRFCIMSATLPSHLQQRLQQALKGTVHTVEPDPQSEPLLLQPRHRLHLLNCRLEACVQRILESLRQGRTVLVVANRVPQAQALYRDLQKHEPNCLLLHSRFVRRDRERIEQRLIQRPPRLLVATQAVEVSLDISYDVCYTELAPADDLVQRFGRVNRQGEHKEPVPVYVCTQYEQERVHRLYAPQRLEATLKHAPDDTPLDWDTTRRWIEAVYQGRFTEQEQRHYHHVSQSFQAVLDALKPLHDTGQTELENLFYVAEVVPSSLQEEYATCLAQRQYLLANQCLTSLPIGLLHALDKQNLVSRHEGTYCVHCAYDEELGLQTDIAEEPSAWIV